MRHNGAPYSGINILMLWIAASANGFSAPIWMTYRQAVELGANVSKGEKGSLVVYANSIVRKETDVKTGDEMDREIHFMKGYTVFNVEQIEGLPAHYLAKPETRFNPVQRIEHPETFFANLRGAISCMARKLIMRKAPIISRCRRLRHSATREATMPRSTMNPRTGPSILPA